jgi:hypothetical protein
MNKEVFHAVERGTESLQINTGARVDANRASKRPSTELHKVNEAVRLLMEAMGSNHDFEAQISEDARLELWQAWTAMNSALHRQEWFEKECRAEQRKIDEAAGPGRTGYYYTCWECKGFITNGDGHYPKCSYRGQDEARAIINHNMRPKAT